jgi:hypothetical protein
MPSESETDAPARTVSLPSAVPLYRNGVSLVGVLITLCSAILMAFALLAQLTLPSQSPYVGIFTYLVFPTFLLVGLLLVAVGMRWEAQRRKKQHALPSLPYPVLDLNHPRARWHLMFTMVGGSLLAVLLAWAVYQGYLYTESVSFCGTTCHVPMEPEHTAYLNSPHARVPCVDCHVGEGASWYVRSKLSGARQVFAVAFDTYRRPIPVPIHDLRPARETCERCHWPEKFNGAKLLQIPHFRYDEHNTAEQISLTLKTGGGSPSFGLRTGIHWHMVVGNTVTYAPLDDTRQSIPWMSVRHRGGDTLEYVSKSTQLTPEQIAALPKRVMDCMDCHNRPSHRFPLPDSAIDQALAQGSISSTLPWIKTLGVDGVMKSYPNRQLAHQGIRAQIEQYYRERYPELAVKRASDIAAAIEVVCAVYDRGVFPDMQVDFGTYSSNIGHRYGPGCFRCHDNDHVAAGGRQLPHDCGQTCHTQPVRGILTPLGEVHPATEADWHPWQMPEQHLSIEGHDRAQCFQCHFAGRRPSGECSNCH